MSNPISNIEFQIGTVDAFLLLTIGFDCQNSQLHYQSSIDACWTNFTWMDHLRGMKDFADEGNE